MQYPIQFLRHGVGHVSELIADARSADGAIGLVADLDWPPHAAIMRVLDTDGREVHSASKGDARA
jgi:hypothetical protein